MTYSGVTVPEAVCHEWRRRYARGENAAEIGTTADFSPSTIRRHIANDDGCHHGPSEHDRVTTNKRDCPFCGETVATLPDHLPCDAVDADGVVGGQP